MLLKGFEPSTAKDSAWGVSGTPAVAGHVSLNAVTQVCVVAVLPSSAAVQRRTLVDGPAGTMRWVYRVVGEETGKDLVQFTLSVPGSVSDLPCRVLGLQLQITLNGIENTGPDELDCYMELAEAAREVSRLELKLAQENLQVIQASFQEGRANLRDVERARLDENEKWVAFLDSDYDRQKAQLDLLNTTGDLDKLFK